MRQTELRASRLAWLLPALLPLLPFEPRRPVLPLPGMLLTVLEGAAIMAVVFLAIDRRCEIARLLRRPPWPLALLIAYAGAHLLSATLAEAPRFAPFKFALRMAASTAFALVVAAHEWKTHRRAVEALTCSTLVVAALAVSEVRGVRAVDPFLDLFRQATFQVGSTRRATAGSEYPNLAAAFLVVGLVASAGVLRSRLGSTLAVTLLVGGLLCTYSRGALAAAALGLLGLLLARRRSGASIRSATVALATLLAGSVAFASSSEAFRLRLRGQGPGGWFNARYAPSETVIRLSPGESQGLSVELENIGLARWRVSERSRLVQRWFDPSSRALREGPTSPLPRDVGPGERASVSTEIRAPWEAGRYEVFLDLCVGARCFSEDGVRPGVINLQSQAGHPAEPAAGSAGVPPDEVLPAYWQPTRAEFTRLALAMWRDRPLTGVGPDNFRLLHSRYAGRPDPDPWAFASNTLLEVAATTGLIGLSCFVSMLVATGAAAIAGLRRSARGSEESAWAALLVALFVATVTHDCVDYFLEATGHYLFFGFLVGSVVRARAFEEHLDVLDTR